MTITLGTFTPGAYTFFPHMAATAGLFSAVGLYPEAAEFYVRAANNYASIGDNYSAGSAYWSAGEAREKAPLPSLTAFKNAVEQFKASGRKWDVERATKRYATALLRGDTTPSHLIAAGEAFSEIEDYLSAGVAFTQAEEFLRSRGALGEAYTANINGGQNIPLYAAIARFRMARIIGRDADDPEVARTSYLESAQAIDKALLWYTATDRILEASQLLFLKGIILEKAGEYSSAAEAFHAGWEKNRSAYTAWREGLALMSAGLFVPAADGPLQTAAEDYNSADDLLLQGAVYYNQGEALLLTELFFDARYAFSVAGSAFARLAVRYAKKELPAVLVNSARGWSAEAGEKMNEINQTEKFILLKRLAEDVMAGRDGAIAELANALGVDRSALISELNAGEGNLYERLVRTVGPNSVGAYSEKADKDDQASATEEEGAVL